MCVIVVGKCNLLRCDLNLNSGTQVKLLGVKEVEGNGGGKLEFGVDFSFGRGQCIIMFISINSENNFLINHKNLAMMTMIQRRRKFFGSVAC